ncbi:hypothetical protein DAPPUDRAFT_331561 [Daphnia pulex]|uniref:Uncharacterized protein n=1 Tax=Daphnia pulex TaxID=6669 RepID=E9HMT4_DAPPU|nr:hypothetical protein DAPPUDRAFT_331561 [Daphnia pulex]|eukprot:EFX66949.1 hypothetical protein DAPPUDRAFT_331561 [Daphnia pulex]
MIIIFEIERTVELSFQLLKGTNAASTGLYCVTTPFANNQPSQFTPGYPSSNLPNGRMLSAPSPTVNFSLLTPSTDPSSNFQTGQQQGNCCQGVLVELQNLQKEVGKLCKALQSNSSHTNSRRVLDFHHSFLQNLIDDCPKNSVRSFVDLNTTLKDPKLAISMSTIAKLVKPLTALRILSTANSFYLVRFRPCNILSFIAVCIMGYGAERKIECGTNRVIELIKNARKLSSQVY